MKTNQTKLKHFYVAKLTIFVAVLSLFTFLTNCDSDEHLEEVPEPIVQEIIDEGLHVERITLAELQQEQSLTSIVKNLSQSFDVNKKGNSEFGARGVDANDGSFTILTEEILTVITPTTRTYTFQLENPTDAESTFENFVIDIFNDTNIRFYIYKYKFDENSSEEFPYIINYNEVDEDLVNMSAINGLFARTDMEICKYSTWCLPCEYGYCHPKGDCVGDGATYVDIVNCTGGSSDGDSNSGDDTSSGEGDGTSSGSGGGSGGTGGSNGEEDHHSDDINDGGNPTDNSESEDGNSPTAVSIPYDLQIEECVLAGGGELDPEGTKQTAFSIFDQGWFDIAGNNEQAAMANYLKVNGCTEDTKEFAAYVSQTFEDGDKINYEDKIVLDLTFVDSNIECIHNSLKNNDFYNDMLSHFSSNIKGVLKFKSGSTLNGDWGITKGDFDNFNEFTITVNSELNSSSNLINMVTLSHELIHAYMFSTLENWGYIIFDIEGDPYLNLTCNSGIDYNSINLNELSVKERFVAIICAFNQNNTLTVSWSHDLFNLWTFNIDTYREELEGLLLLQHDWDGEVNSFKNEAINVFGSSNWKSELAKAISFIGLEDTQEYFDYLNSYSDVSKKLYILDINNKVKAAKKSCI